MRTRADYSHRVPVAGADEVARLGQGFNAMMEAIEDRDAELRRLSAMQRAVLENVGSGIISVAPDGAVTTFNRAAERLLGYTADEVVGKLTPQAWHDPQEVERRARELSAQLGETIEPGMEVFFARARRNLPEEGEWSFIRKDGTRAAGAADGDGQAQRRRARSWASSASPTTSPSASRPRRRSAATRTSSNRPCSSAPPNCGWRATRPRRPTAPRAPSWPT